MDETEFKARTKRLALRVILLVSALPKNEIAAEVIGKQLLRSATSVGDPIKELANIDFRFISFEETTGNRPFALMAIASSALKSSISNRKLSRLELLVESELMPAHRLKNLMAETNEIVAMLVSSLKTLRDKSKQSRIYNSPQSPIL